MDATAINEAIKICVGEICGKPDEAKRLARAAAACILADTPSEGIEVSMEIEHLIYEA